MSRARVHEVSSPISLFPFIGILLCTMGALLVILVAVSRSAKDTAQREVGSEKHVAAKAATEGARKKIFEVETYLGNLNSVRGKAVARLRDEQARLSHVEDHIRRLHEKIQSLQSAAVELQALEQEHYDDHKQTIREIDRLHKLIDESKKTLETLQADGDKAPRSYAVVPYEGPNGTFRRPVYIECVKGELVLQPEGVRIKAEDLRPPYTPGNPLASVLRATRDHLVRLNPKLGESRDVSPYPLMLVRPEGLLLYDKARQAIEAGDFDLGFELVESNWKLKFPQADPQLAEVQAQALEQARARQQVLAAAAPRAYGGSAMASAGAFDDDDYGGGGGGSGYGGGGGRSSGLGGGSREYIVSRGGGGGSGGDGGDGDGEGLAGGGGSDVGGEGSGSGGGGGEFGGNGGGLGSGNLAASGMQAGGGGAESGTSGGLPGGSGGGGGAPNGSGSGGGGGGGSIGASGSAPAGSAPDKNLVPDGYQGQQSGSAVVGTGAPGESDGGPSGPDLRSAREKAMSAESRGKDWALKQKPPRSVPVRRTIRVTVAKDKLMILPDAGAAGGKTIALKGDTVESVDEFVKQVRDHIEGWGIAGKDLYWRPVVVLNVQPDGQVRASDLNRLLKNSGLEVRADETAKNVPQGGGHETR